ncbi:MAG: nodulation protein NodZ [Bacteroidota bacterium]
MAKKRLKKVISRRNAGFGDNLFAAAHAWYYAKETGRELVINWAPSMYLDDKSLNAFYFFFDVPDQIEGVPIIVEKRINPLSRMIRALPVTPFKHFFPVLTAEVAKRFVNNYLPATFANAANKRHDWIVNTIKEGKDVSENTLIFNGCYSFLNDETKPFFKNLKLKPTYQEKVNAFADRYFTGKTVIGVHVRYYDKNLPVNNHTKYWLEPEKSLKTINSRLKEVVDEIKNNSEDHVIFLATDNEMVQSSIRNAFENVITYDKEFDIVQKGMHLHLSVETAFNTLIEMFLLARSDIMYRFPPSGSWFSHYGALHAKKVVI